MSKENKVVLVYLTSFLVIILGSSLHNNKSLIEIGLSKIGIHNVYSSSQTGLYYPGIFTIIILSLMWYLLRKTNLKPSLHQYYPLYCIGMLILVKSIYKIII